jgi:hypothetical protein
MRHRLLRSLGFLCFLLFKFFDIVTCSQRRHRTIMHSYLPTPLSRLCNLFPTRERGSGHESRDGNDEPQNDADK